MSRRILVTGGGGFIGSHLVDELVAAGEEVVVLDDLSRGRREWIHPEAALHELDIRDAASLRRTLPRIRPEVVVHLAAMHFIPAVDDAPRLATTINELGTRNVVKALAATPPELILFTSTAAVYPDRPGPIDESCRPAPIDLYGRTKLQGERLIYAFAKRASVRAVIARLFNVIGKRETNPHVVPAIVEQLANGSDVVRVGNTKPRRDYTDVRDVADALRRLIHPQRDGHVFFNVGSGRPASVIDVVRVCEQVLGRPIAVQVDQERVRARDRAELLADGRLLRETTGWKPSRTLHETLAELLTGNATG
jgi:UDP-glucose 4-epimerase